jgi:hypothetical protein
MGVVLGGMSRKGHNLKHHDGISSRGDRSGATRLEGLDGEDNEEAEGEEGQDGANDQEGLVMIGWWSRAGVWS